MFAPDLKDGKARHTVSAIGLEMGLSKDPREAGKMITKWLFETRVIEMDEGTRAIMEDKIRKGEFEPADNIFWNDEGKEYIVKNFPKVIVGE